MKGFEKLVVRRLVLGGALVLLLACGVGGYGAGTASGPAVIPPDPPVVGEVRHELLCMDNRRHEVLRISPAGKVVWSVPAPGVHDAWLLPDGNVLFCYYDRKASGVKIVSPEKKEVFHYRFPKRCEVHACQPLSNGNILIGAAGPARVVEVDRTGKVVKTVPLVSKHKNPHLHLRQVRQLVNGNYLVCHVGDKTVREYDAAGKVLREMPGGTCRAAVRLPNGNTLITSGDKCTVTELDAKDKVVWQITKDDFPEIRMDWLAGVQRLPNGNTVICNWLGHGKFGQGVPIFEVTRDKKIVWMFTDSKTTKAVTGVQVLDVKADVTKGEALR